METIEVNTANALALHKGADKKGKQLLEKLLPNIFSGKITDRVKTFDDAWRIFQKINFKDALYKTLQLRGKQDLTSADKIIIISRVLNEDWIPDWSDSSQYKYYPWFEYKAGSGFSSGGYGRWDAYSSVGSRLCFKTKELAMYAGKQFEKIYVEFFTIKNL